MSVGAAILAGVVVVGMLPRGAEAQGVPVAGSPTPAIVEVSIGAVLASNVGDEVDPRLVDLRPQLDRLLPHFSSYQLVSRATRQVQWGGKVRLDMPGERYVLVIPKRVKDDRVSLRVIMVEGRRPTLHTALSLKSGATLLLGGPRDPRGGSLIVAIDAAPVY